MAKTKDTEYAVTITQASRELSAREKLKIMDTTGATHLNEACEDGALEIEVSAFAVLDIHNEKADDKEYKNYVLLSKEGEVFNTGSESFAKQFNQIAEVMAEEGETEFTLRVFSRESKNYKGKKFLTCSLV